MLDCQLWGVRAGWHHATNVVLHTITVILLFNILRQTTGALWRSAFVATVFAIHPLRSESVAWISERKDVLSGVFFMLTLACYANYARRAPSLWRYGVVVIVFAIGLLTKPMLVTVPLILLLLDFWPSQRFTEPSTRKDRTAEERKAGVRRLFLEKIPLLLLSGASCVATLKAQGQYISSSDVLPLTSRLGNACISYLTYIGQTIWPTRLTAFYPLQGESVPSWKGVASVLVIAGITFAVFIARRRQPYLLVGWLWYLVMLVPVIGLVQVGWQEHADRYTYLPSIGLLIALTWGAGSLPTPARLRVRLFAATAGMVIAALSVVTWKQTGYWRNSEALWTRALTVTNNNDVAENNLGVLLLARGQVSEAISRYEKAIALRPTNTEARTNLANALLYQGRLDEATDQLRRTLEMQPENVEARNTLGAALIRRGQAGAAIAEWERVLAEHPDNGNAQANLAWVLATSPHAELRNGRRALDLAQRALQLSGGTNAMIFRTLGAAYAENGRFSEASQSAEKGLLLAITHRNTALIRDFEMNIASYRAGEPLRDGTNQPGAAAGQANKT